MAAARGVQTRLPFERLDRSHAGGHGHHAICADHVDNDGALLFIVYSEPVPAFLGGHVLSPVHTNRPSNDGMEELFKQVEACNGNRGELVIDDAQKILIPTYSQVRPRLQEVYPG